MHSIIVLVQYLRVVGLEREWWIDLPELTSIRLGNSAFQFSGGDSTELIMRSDDDEMNWWIDLPKLTTLTTEENYSTTFSCPHIITLEGHLIILYSQTDMPSLTTVTLIKEHTFREKKTVHTKSPFPPSPSFLDITPALQQYLQFIVSFIRHFHPNTKSPFSLHTTITPFLSDCHSFYSYQYISCHAIKHSFKPILSFCSNSRDQPKYSLW